MTTIEIPVRADGQFYLSPSQVDKKDSQVKLVNKTPSPITIISPTPYNIEGQIKATLQISQYATLQLVQKEFFMVDGNLLIAPTNLNNNTINIANVIGAGIPYTVVKDLIAGNNAIQHNLNATPRQISFQQAGEPIGLGYSTAFYADPLNILNVTSTKALSQVSINILAFD